MFAAIEVATGKVTDACYPRHRHQEFLHFLKQVAKAYPRRQLHVVSDNHDTHKHPNVRAWVGRNHRITLHFTPTGSSWMNQAVRHRGRMSTAALIEGGSTDVEGVVPGPVREDRPRLGVRRG